MKSRAPRLLALALAALAGGAALALGCADPEANGDAPSADTDAGAAVAPSPSGNDAAASAPPGSPTVAADAGTPRDAATDAAPPAPAPPPGWPHLVWHDEFDGANGSAIDAAKWNQETGGNGWSTNREREYYTPGTGNAAIENGALVITAKNQGAGAYSCQYGTCLYTSARFNTAGKFEQKYGRFEARIRVPRGQGMWPAFWLLGNDIGAVGWPQCGEIDIMENLGREPSTDHGSMHGPGYSGANPLTASTSLAAGKALADDFHVYAVEWEENVVRFYLDATLFETRTPADVPAGHSWVYDHPFFVILNLAVGGQWPGDPDATTPFPQTMAVDYVRVYSR